ncbi:MAG: hypothetical protein J7J82_03350 [Staphylothermus sp.]|nr:hypothetical protein [Staphylothermus sp.]
MPIRGYRSISLKEDIYHRLLEIASSEGWGSVAETIERLTDLYSSFTVEKKGIIHLISKLLYNGKMPGQIIEPITFGGAYPLIYITYKLDFVEEDTSEANKTKIKIIPIIALNPVSILKAYCTSRKCYTKQLLEQINNYIQTAEKKIKEYFETHKDAVEILKKFNAEVTEHTYEIRTPPENIKALQEELTVSQSA